MHASAAAEGVGIFAAEHTKTIGDRSEAHVLAALVELYPTVLQPWGENQRYDFVVEEQDGGFTRVQVKTGRLRNGAIHFNAFSATYHHPANQGTKHYTQTYRGEADAFAVWCPDTRGVYLVPVDQVGTTVVALRVDPPKNNQRARIRFAADYLVHPPE